MKLYNLYFLLKTIGKRHRKKIIYEFDMKSESLKALHGYGSL